MPLLVRRGIERGVPPLVALASVTRTILRRFTDDHACERIARGFAATKRIVIYGD
jgi:hypothetical protein